MKENLLFIFLKTHNIAYQLFEHQPVFTVDDKPAIKTIDGVTTSSEVIPQPYFKTLFLTDKKGKFFLVSVLEDKHVDLNTLGKQLQCARLTFGKTDELLEYIKVSPGSVTPYGLLFDEQNKVTYIFDKDALNHQWTSFHPMRNDMTIVTSLQNFLTCMQLMHHEPVVMQIPVK
ncbi:TPA: hypothetical protein DEO28_04360 [Candidatus Dependentiae bacterium]|nr:MAG: hypothetical protein UR14_C0006G0109 [candidate division TM6 bacterium GW2011_GWE2_31_21]KKP53468.1 MAG: hypothetical protein UR43_C0004G0009 [candidate division TM6 bacterium GW2011_GWF2_33_332]HBS48290.1 hypothetical protein [Candidatus Dependentiae bacterium]HBZ73717.1 hypothetical protein [Candidatus Dependentiae bacterium]